MLHSAFPRTQDIHRGDCISLHRTAYISIRLKHQGAHCKSSTRLYPVPRPTMARACASCLAAAAACLYSAADSRALTFSYTHVTQTCQHTCHTHMSHKHVSTHVTTHVKVAVVVVYSKLKCMRSSASHMRAHKLRSLISPSRQRTQSADQAPTLCSGLPALYFPPSLLDLPLSSPDMAA